MAQLGDPWQVLGLSPGATLDEVRRAYRRLAKEHHPDTAGESALPRFLAIHAAYDQIVGPGRARRVGARPAGAASGSPPGEPWRADPDRARASGRADGRRPGARPGGRRTAGPAPGAGPGPGAGAAPAAGKGTEPGPNEGRGARPSSGGSTRARRSPKRPPKTATPYSTSYDPADEEPFEPGWSGATWYGASSGTYWTINPKEYADPRKHGPEYQARARRARDGWILDGDEDTAATAEPSERPESTDGSDAEPRVDRQADASMPPAPDSARSRGRDQQPPKTPIAAPWPPASGHRSVRPSRSRANAAFAQARSSGMPFDGAGFDGSPPAAATPDMDAAGFHGPVLPKANTPTGRLAIAILGWPPLGLFAAAAIGESSGCGRYAASCGELFSPGTWILSVAILLLLLAVPAVARWSAHGTIAMLVAGVPAAVILSAAGGTNVPGASAPLLVGVLAVAYLAGIAYALVVPRFGRSG